MSAEPSTIRAAIRLLTSLPTNVLRQYDEPLRKLYAPVKPPGSEVWPIVDALQRNQELSKIYLGLPVKDAVSSRSHLYGADVRILDIKLGSKPSLTDRFCKGLGERSLALEFDQWERRLYQTSTLGTLLSDLSAKDDKRDGHIQEFIRSANLDEKTNNQLHRAIRIGQKILLLSWKLDYSDSIPIFLLCCDRYWQSLKLADLPAVEQKLRQSNLLETARSHQDWFQQCVQKYEGGRTQCTTALPYAYVLNRGDRATEHRSRQACASPASAEPESQLCEPSADCCSHIDFLLRP